MAKHPNGRWSDRNQTLFMLFLWALLILPIYFSGREFYYGP